MRRRDIRIASLLSIVLLIASPVALTTNVPRDSTKTVTMDAGYEYEDARGEYSIDADVSNDSMVTSLDALTILQTTSAGCRIAVDGYTVAVADTIPIPIRFEDGIDVGSLDLGITFEALGVGDGPLDLEIATLTDSSPEVNHLDHSISNGTVTIVPGAVVTIPDVSATGVITVPITIENVSNVGSCQLTLSYDPAVVIVSSASQSDFDSLFANLEGAASGSVSLLAYQTSNPGLDGDVIVANVTFMAMGNSGSSTILDLEVTTFTDTTPGCNPIPYTIRNGSFTMFPNGDVNGDSRVDVNGDSRVDVADCMFLAKHLIGVSGFETIVADAADVNGNGMIEASDCMYLAKHLAGIDGFEVLK